MVRACAADSGCFRSSRYAARRSSPPRPADSKAAVAGGHFVGRGAGEQAVAMARQAVTMGKNLPYAFGPPTPEKPSYELLGELLLKEHNNSPARAAFQASLLRAPKRTESSLVWRAQKAPRETRQRQPQTWRQLLGIWKNADPSTVRETTFSVISRLCRTLRTKTTATGISPAARCLKVPWGTMQALFWLE